MIRARDIEHTWRDANAEVLVLDGEEPVDSIFRFGQAHGLDVSSIYKTCNKYPDKNGCSGIPIAQRAFWIGRWMRTIPLHGMVPFTSHNYHVNSG